MFLVDEPYISEFFKKTVNDNSIPVVGTGVACKLNLHAGTRLLSEEAAVNAAGEEPLMLYTTSENAISWIDENLGFTGIPDKINLFKNKVRFRELTKHMFPGFFYQAVSFSDLRTIDAESLPFPVIIKPAVGFFSMGVYLVSDYTMWNDVADAIEAEMEKVKGLYPRTVLGRDTFLIEQCITGEEFAVDAYFDSDGTAVITNILNHSFSSEGDVSDRVYSTSKSIIEENLEEFTAFLNSIGKAAQVRNFPVHLELRRSPGGELLPIEVNPMRFGGWCTTADMAALAYGFNPYLYYYRQIKPDWPELLAGKDGLLFSIIVLDNSTGIAGSEIKAFDYDKLLRQFKKPLELRRIDYGSYPVFGFLFAETPAGNTSEIDYILSSDLREFIIV